MDQFFADLAAASSAKNAMMRLWQGLGGQVSTLEGNYAEDFSHSYSDGSVSFLPLIGRVEGVDELDREEFAEVVDNLVRVDPSDWPDPESILSISRDFAEEHSYNFPEFEMNFEEGDMSKKVEILLKSVIATVYRDGVERVVDAQGKVPSEDNNYLMSPDGLKFTGVFITSPVNGKRETYPFTIQQKDEGEWEIQY